MSTRFSQLNAGAGPGLSTTLCGPGAARAVSHICFGAVGAIRAAYLAVLFQESVHPSLPGASMVVTERQKLVWGRLDSSHLQSCATLDQHVVELAISRSARGLPQVSLA